MMASSPHPPGTFAWIERLTRDPDTTVSFYAELFDWSVTRTREDPLWVQFRKEGRPVAGLRSRPSGRWSGNEQWISYVGVRRLDQVAKRAEQAGGRLLATPARNGDGAPWLLAADPAGAVFGLWNLETHSGADVFNEPGSLCWNELGTYRPDEAAEFYKSVFGWEPIDMELTTSEAEYVVFENEGREQAGMLELQDVETPIQPAWGTYVTVANLGRATRRLQALGGSVARSPTEADVGRAAIVRDPLGAHFSLMELQETAPRR